jgi:hypothetical protein
MQMAEGRAHSLLAHIHVTVTIRETATWCLRREQQSAGDFMHPRHCGVHFWPCFFGYASLAIHPSRRDNAYYYSDAQFSDKSVSSAHLMRGGRDA